MEWLGEELGRLEEERLRRRPRTIASLPGGRCRVEGRELWNFASNDYLSVSHDPRVLAAARAALEEGPAGATAASLVCGRSPWHERLEASLAAFEGEAASVLFPTGAAANLGVLTALAGSNDTIYCDRLNHASLVDGCRLSGAKLVVYRHDELDRLERQLQKPAGPGRRFIVTDTVFSMDGDTAPLPELCELKSRYGAHLIVDEAHGTGVYGEHGRGVCEEQGVEGRVDVRVGTMSKGLGGLGGFVAGPRELVDYLVNKARTYVFSTALPPSVCAGVAAALDVVRTEPERRHHLRRLQRLLRDRFTVAGLCVPAGEGPIVPVILGGNEHALAASARLAEFGYLVPAIRPPTVPAGTARLRISLQAALSEERVTAFAADVVRAAKG